MNYYELVPLLYIGNKNDTLVYQSENNLKSGQAVIISVRNKKLTGIIIKKVAKPSFETKDIIEVIFERPVLNSALLKTASWMSEYYASTLTSVFQTMLPVDITKKRRDLKNNEKRPDLDKPPVPTPDQGRIIKAIESCADDKPHLLFGVTGSGKTEIYLKLIETVLNKGQQVIVLVPEVSLTAQAMNRFQARFGNRVALFHSYLKETERFASWKAIFDGEKDIVVGSRSALFAPLKNLGLVIIDEEHESSYKQDQSPRYHAIKTAQKICQLGKAKLLLGSATPSFESYFKALNGQYHLHKLDKRIHGDTMPLVQVVDMRNEYQSGNKSIFSDIMLKRINENLTEKKQVLLFLNRRGMSTFVSCRDCGYVVKCPNCDLPLTFHFNNLNLVCHHCDYKGTLPTLCPNCQSAAIKYFGTGTQRVEQELIKLIDKKFTIGRMDRDTTRKQDSHYQIYEDFATKNVDILIGTQMITKGWDFPNVGLVGIISADTMINFPDYNASERTFNLLTQVAGRTGRGEAAGEVILQTYNPDHPAIKYASKHDFNGFFEQEIKNRKELNYPPFAHLIKLMYNNKDIEQAKDDLESINERINLVFNNSLDIVGPSPAFIPKIANKYRWQLVIKTDDEKIINIVNKLPDLLNNNWIIDVDPIGII